MTPARADPDLRGMFGAGVVCGVARIRPGVRCRFPEESAPLARATPARRAEFATGRLLVGSLLRSLGAPDAPILVGPQRAPVWPEGFTASIAHAEDVCIGAAARGRDSTAIGLDLEPANPLDLQIAATVCTDADRAASAPFWSTGADLLPVGAFVVKEAVFKTLFPLTGARLEFADVVAQTDPLLERFRATVNHDAVPADLRALHGRFRLTNGWAVAAIALSPSRSTPPPRPSPTETCPA